MGTGGAPKVPKLGSSVHVECWCMAKVIKVPVEEVAAFRTGSCKAADCRPPSK